MRTQVTASRSVSNSVKPVWDFTLLFCALMLAMTGWLMITSASLDVSEHNYGQPGFYFIRHGVYLLLSLVVAGITLFVPIAYWRRWATAGLVASFILLAVIFIPGVGHSANSATRWLAIGPLTLQVSELAKLGMLVYLASYLVRQQALVRSHILGFINPMIVIVLLVGLLLEQPDFGAVVVILSASLGMLFLGGVRVWEFVLLLLAAVVAMALMIYAEEYRLARLTAYLNPWDYSEGGGYQLVQSLIAFGRGEFLGLGLGNSIQKLFFLPEAHTDFVFAVIAEELGLLGCIALLAGYALMIYRMLLIAHIADRRGQNFSAYLVYGIALVFSIQLFINVGVSTGLLPTKGLTLPFISYGGTSLLVSSIFVAIVLRVGRELAEQEKAHQSRRGGVVTNRSVRANVEGEAYAHV